jgi:hypothetical protein
LAPVEASELEKGVINMRYKIVQKSPKKCEKVYLMDDFEVPFRVRSISEA